LADASARSEIALDQASGGRGGAFFPVVVLQLARGEA
jgi:hypothetical protein